MLDHVENIFNNMPEMLKRLKKASYAERMERFRDEHGHFFREMTDAVELAEDRDAQAAEIAAAVTAAAEERFAVRGKIKARTQTDMNLFMIYYVFPAILMTRSACADQVAQAVRDGWSQRFKNSNIGYTDYESLLGSFNEKIFGIF